jgi:hypothetical protein
MRAGLVGPQRTSRRRAAGGSDTLAGRGRSSRRGDFLRSGRASPTRSARRGTAPASTSRSSRRRPARELCLFAPNGATSRDTADRADGSRVARLPAGVQARTALRVPRPREVRSARGPSLQPRQAAPGPVRDGDRRPAALERLAVRVPHRRSRGGSLEGRAGQRAVRLEERRDRSRVHLGGTRAPGPRGTRPSSTSSTSRASTKLHPLVPERLRGTFAGLAVPEVIEIPAVARRHGD